MRQMILRVSGIASLRIPTGYPGIPTARIPVDGPVEVDVVVTDDIDDAKAISALREHLATQDICFENCKLELLRPAASESFSEVGAIRVGKDGCTTKK